MMNWYKATDQQLQTIFIHEYNLPNHLLVGLVGELITRKSLDGMIIYQAKRIMAAYDREEVMQAGYLAVYQLAKIFKVKQLSFKDMCFIAIERRLKTLIQKKFQKKNFMNEQALMNEVPVMTSEANVERTVILKLTLQEQLERLSEKQRRIVTLFLDGYSLKWIGEHIYNQDTSAIRYQFKDALRRMNIHDYKIGAKTGLKGA